MGKESTLSELIAEISVIDDFASQELINKMSALQTMIGVDDGGYASQYFCGFEEDGDDLGTWIDLEPKDRRNCLRIYVCNEMEMQTTSS